MDGTRQQPVCVASAQETAQSNANEARQRLADLPLELVVTLPSFSLRVRDLLALRPGTMLRSARAVGEPFLVSINDAPVALGEVFASDERLSVRLLKVGSCELT